MDTYKSSVNIYDDKYEAVKAVADKISALIREKDAMDEKTILGLATGNTPIPLYQELIKMHKEQGLSFKNVVSFNLDEYYPISRSAIQSYHNFMYRNLFSQIDILPENVHVPNGEIEEEDIERESLAYEKLIQEAGGIDFQILGIGHNGHIGFNEPGSSLDSKTRKIDLTESTRNANSFEFDTLNDIPRHAVSMGIDTILKSKEIALLAWGDGKADAIEKSIEGEPTPDVPASLLQYHKNVSYYLDKVAASKLKNQ